MPFLSGWSKRKEIQYGTVFPDSNLTDFPILVVIDSDSDIASELTSGGGIAITSADETTEIPFGVYPSSDLSTGDIILRFKTNVNSAASTGDTLAYIYYDSGQTTTEDRQGTVSNNYELFLTLDENPGGSAPQFIDWTSNNNDATNHGPTQTTGIISNSVDFDGVDDYIDVPVTNLPDIDGEKTIELWTQHNGTVNGSRTFRLSLCLNDTSGANNAINIEVRSLFDTMKVSACQWGGAERCTAYLTTGGISADEWFLLAYRTDSSWSNQAMFLNGVDCTFGGETASSSNAGASGVCRIGSMNTAFPDPYCDRPIDEVRISSVSRSSVWLEYAYNNDFSPEDTTQLGAEETDSGTGTEATDAEVILDALVAQGVIVAPTITTGVVIGLSALVASGTITTQTVSNGNIVDLTALSTNGVIVAPVTVVEGDATVVLTPVTANGLIIQPTITHGNIVDLTSLTGNGTLATQTVDIGSLISLTPITGNGNLVDISLGTGNRLDLDPILSRGVIVDPSLTLGTSVTLSALTGRAVLPNLNVDNGGEEPVPPVLGVRYTLDFRDLIGTVSNTTTLSATLNYR